MSLEHTDTQIIGTISSDPFSLALEVGRKFYDIFSGNMREYYLNLYGQSILDPFAETKKKCLPDNPDNLPFDERGAIDSEIVHYLVNPLTIEKRDGPSFADAQMNNLIVDKNDTLLQLVYSHTIGAPIFPGLRLMKTTEYTNGEGRVVARKFEQYI